MPFRNPAFLLGFTLGLVLTVTFAFALTFPTLAAGLNLAAMVVAVTVLHRRRLTPRSR